MSDAVTSPTTLTATEAPALCASLRSARAAGLAQMSVAEIVAALHRAMSGWRDPSNPLRCAALDALPEHTGYHPAMVARGLDDLAQAFSGPELGRLLHRELADPAVLDRFVPRADGRGHERAHGPGLTAVVLSGNVPPVTAEGIILPLLTKSACIVKVPRREPVFPTLLARALDEADRRLGAAVAVRAWTGGDAPVETAVFGAVDAVIVYGGAEAVAGVRARTPATTRFVAHGPKVSVAVVDRQAINHETAMAAAYDIAVFDQQGCVSPHAIYVRGDAEDTHRFGTLLAEAMTAVERELPRGRIGAAEAARIQQARGAAEFRDGATVHADTGTSWTVIIDPEPGFALSCLNRLVHVKPLTAPADLAKTLEPVRSYLQIVGVAGSEEFVTAVAEAVSALGASRVCALGQMQHPPAAWRHDGRPRLLDLLRWTDLDPRDG